VSHQLSALYQVPLEILYHGTFEEVEFFFSGLSTLISFFFQAKDFAKKERKWLLVNIQDNSEFACHVLNRDVWANDGIKELIKCGFIFWQQLECSHEGQNYCRLYNVKFVLIFLLSFYFFL
jgi:thioredoxin-related protein